MLRYSADLTKCISLELRVVKLPTFVTQRPLFVGHQWPFMYSIHGFTVFHLKIQYLQTDMYEKYPQAIKFRNCYAPTLAHGSGNGGQCKIVFFFRRPLHSKRWNMKEKKYSPRRGYTSLPVNFTSIPDILLYCSKIVYCTSF